MTSTYTAGGIRIPPNSDEAEMAVLGAMMLSREAVNKALATLVPDCFYRPAHRIVYEAMISLVERGSAIDFTTLRHELGRKGEKGAQNAAEALAGLNLKGVNTANVEHYIAIVHEKWLKRRLLSATSDIQSDCYAPSSDVHDLIDRAERRVFEIAEHSTRDRGRYSMKFLTDEARRMLESVRNRDVAGISSAFGISTGMVSLDGMTGGLQNSDLIVIAARPAMGKSGLALSIARNVAVEGKVPVGFFTLEMSPQQLMLRLLSADARVDAHKLRIGRLDDGEWRRAKEALRRLQAAPLFIEDAPGLSIMELRARARLMKREQGVGLIIVDYLQLMQAPKAERREREISMISKSLKQLAKELNIPVIALSQLNRAVEARSSKRPILSDLRESGAIEEDSDLVMFIHRPEYYGEKYYENGDSTEGVAEVIIAKHRNGPTGVAKLSFEKEYARFATLKERDDGGRYLRSVANG